MENNKVVYIHRKASNREVFYVGMGNPDRPYHKSISERSKFWHRIVDKHGYSIEVIRTGLTKREAFDIEMDLIELIGRRDKKKGTLVNLSNGGDGANGNGTYCYNIETGKMYTSISDASNDLGIAGTTLRDRFNGRREFDFSIPIREVNNPYPEDKLPKGTEYLEELHNYDSEYRESPEFNDYETDLLDKIDSLLEEDIELIDMSYNMSVREIAVELDTNRMSVSRRLKKIRETILGDDIHLYKNKSLKHLKNIEAKVTYKKNKPQPNTTSANYFMEKMLKRQERYSRY